MVSSTATGAGVAAADGDGSTRGVEADRGAVERFDSSDPHVPSTPLSCWRRRRSEDRPRANHSRNVRLRMQSPHFPYNKGLD